MVAENWRNHSTRQCNGAQEARKSFRNVDSMSINNFKCMFRLGDAEIAEDTWGSDIDCLKGTTMRSARPIAHDSMKIPRELKMQNQKTALRVDVMGINGEGFLSLIGTPSQCGKCSCIMDKTGDWFCKALDEAVRKCNDGGFHIETMECGGKLKSLMDEVKGNMGITLIQINRGNHEPMAEKNNRTIVKVSEWQHTEWHTGLSKIVIGETVK